MKNIMISIKPEWVEKILNGEKTIEIRKTMPKCKLPCRVFIYCTKDSPQLLNAAKLTTGKGDGKFFVRLAQAVMNGKVVAEFTLKTVEKIEQNQIYSAEVMQKKAYMSIKQLNGYTGGKTFFAWHIDDLQVYDQPKELSDFLSIKECSDKDWGDSDTIGCWECCDAYDRGCCYGGKEPMRYAPQSYCYCEEIR